MSAKRRWVIEEATDPETGATLGSYDRDQLMGCFEELEHVLYMVGGMAAFTTERVQVAELGGQPLAVSRRVIVDWTAFAPMRREDRADESEELDVPTPDDALTAGEWNGAPDDGGDDEEDVDRSLTTAGPPREDATL